MAREAIQIDVVIQGRRRDLSQVFASRAFCCAPQLRDQQGYRAQQTQKKESHSEPANRPLLKTVKPDEIVLDVYKVEEAEVDEMWSYVGTKKELRWLWHALDHSTGNVRAYVVGARRDAVFLKLKAVLAPFGITHYYTDKAGVYRRHIPPKQHTVRKRSTQKIECKHLTLRRVYTVWPARRCVSPAHAACTTCALGYI